VVVAVAAADEDSTHIAALDATLQPEEYLLCKVFEIAFNASFSFMNSVFRKWPGLEYLCRAMQLISVLEICGCVQAREE
jgi:hypothetical protein